jgi:hypothetical protein
MGATEEGGDVLLPNGRQISVAGIFGLGAKHDSVLLKGYG